MEVLMQPNRLMSTIVRKSSMVLHSISAQSEIPALFTTAQRPENKDHMNLSEIHLGHKMSCTGLKT